MTERFLVDPRTAGRADKAVAARFPHVGRRRIAELFARGAVRVDGKRTNKGDLVHPGQEIIVTEVPQDHPSLAPVPEPDLELVVLHEDRDLIACQKLGGIPSHPLRPGDAGTLANALVARYPECAHAGADAREAGLLHRLDAGTSGILVAARHERAWRAMRRAFAEREVRKRYLALVAPVTADFGDSGESRAPLVQRGSRVIVALDPAAFGGVRALSAHTEWRVLERPAPGYCMVECTARTGRMHQVRAHLAHAGAPIAGDVLYGGPALPGVGDAPMAGFFLHASALEFTHPGTGLPMTLDAPLPGDRQAVLARLRQAE